MAKITLRIAAGCPIHGKKPGEDFETEADAGGVPLTLIWRKRLADGGAVRIDDTQPAKPASPKPAAKERA